MDAVIAWLLNSDHWQGNDGIPTRLFEHLTLSGAAIVVALLIALPIGIAIGHSGRGALVAINLSNIGRAVPSYALIVMLLPVTTIFDPKAGFTTYPVFLAMVVLAIPPVLVNTYAGIREVDRELVEAARGMGMRERQILSRVEWPIAVPVILGGVRTAAVQVVATATLGAIVGYGGLGRYLIDGEALHEYDRLFAGVVLVAGLAILTELFLSLVQRRLTSPGLAAAGMRTRAFREQAPVGEPGSPEQLGAA